MSTSDKKPEHVPRQQGRKKYKDSCNNCASSKVKCNRDRPQCSRCEDRGLTCVYTLSQRSGRRPTTSNQAASNTDHTIKSASHSRERTAHSNDSKGPSQVQGCEQSPPTSALATSFEPDIFGSINANDVMNWEAMEENFANGEAGFDSMSFDTSVSYSTFCPDLMDDAGLWLSEASYTNPTPTELSLESTSILSQSAGMFGIEGMQLQPSRSLSSATADSNARKASCCPTRAGEILTRLRKQASNCCLSESQNPSDQHSNSTTFEDIIMVNRECIEDVMVMLDCPCAAEQQTVFMISMIVFEVLNRYNSTALGCTKGTSSTNALDIRSTVQPLGLGKYQIEGPDAMRMRTALILGELHLVVRLLERISRRSQETRDTDTALHGQGGLGSALTSEPISASVFVQVQADMKKRMGLVRENLTQMMRQG